jgi:hypothetical protein
MSTDCSFFGDSSGNPACANWWIIDPKPCKNTTNISKPWVKEDALEICASSGKPLHKYLNHQGNGQQMSLLEVEIPTSMLGHPSRYVKISME